MSHPQHHQQHLLRCMSMITLESQMAAEKVLTRAQCDILALKP